MSSQFPQGSSPQRPNDDSDGGSSPRASRDSSGGGAQSQESQESQRQSEQSQGVSQESDTQPSFNAGPIITGAFTLLVFTILSGGWILIPILLGAVAVGIFIVVCLLDSWFRSNSSSDGRDP